MEYTIGQISRLLGLSIEGIRNYEKGGIIRSKRTEASNYRKYSYLDITSLIRARMYRSLGFSITETSYLTNEGSIEEILGRLSAQKEALRREIILAEHKLKRLSEIEQSLDALEGELNRVTLCESPAVYRVEFSHNGVVDFSERTVATFQAWMDCAPFVYVSSRYCRGEVYGGLAIDEKYAELLNIKPDDVVQFHPASMGLRLTVMEEDNDYSDVNVLSMLHEYADRHSFTLSEDMIGHTVIGVNKIRAYRRYRRIYADIKDM